jgi:hypothetical protein
MNALMTFLSGALTAISYSWRPGCAGSSSAPWRGMPGVMTPDRSCRMHAAGFGWAADLGHGDDDED